MARSQLARSLAQAYASAAQAQASKTSPPELVEPPQAASSPTAHAAPQPWVEQDPTLSAQPQHGEAASILVVGAGLAGLVVAYRLQQAGFAVDLIEGRDRIGGRILSLPNALQTGLVAELGGEVFDSAHTCALGLAAELGLPIVDSFKLLPSEGQATYFFSGRHVSLTELVSHFAAVVSPLQKDLEAVQQFLHTGIATPAVEALDRLSVAEYMASIGASDLLQSVVNVAYTIRYGMDAQEQSCLNLLAFIRPQPGVFHLFGLSDERYFLKGGNDQLTRELARHMASSLETGTLLEALRPLSDGRYRVSLRQGWGRCDRTYERVVLTLPFNLLRRLSLQVDLPPRQRRAINTLGYNSPTKIVTAYRQKRWRNPPQGNGLIFTDLPMQHAWESSGSLLSQAC
ncbi:MAG TPA: FAD-dependent oxidoreductase, partial [Trichocoleus sp.]